MIFSKSNRQQVANRPTNPVKWIFHQLLFSNKRLPTMEYHIEKAYCLQSHVTASEINWIIKVSFCTCWVAKQQMLNKPLPTKSHIFNSKNCVSLELRTQLYYITPNYIFLQFDFFFVVVWIYQIIYMHFKTILKFSYVPTNLSVY